MTRPARTREQALQQLADDIPTLVATMTTTTEHQRGPGPGADGVSRPQPEQRVHHVRHLGLIHQLVAALTPGAPTRDGRPERRRPGPPGSRQPSATAASDALNDITEGWAAGDQWHIGVRDLRTRLRVASGRITNAYRPRVPPVAALFDVRNLAHTVPDPYTLEAAHAVAAYVARARAALAYDPRTVTLRDTVCPYCAGPLRVASDASSDVWCATNDCVDDQGRRRTWPKGEWVLLLERMAAQNG